MNRGRTQRKGIPIPKTKCYFDKMFIQPRSTRVHRRLKVEKFEPGVHMLPEGASDSQVLTIR
jgi:hypothetical protein